MALRSRMSSRARLVLGCRCERPLPQRDVDGTSCVKCGHDIEPTANQARPPKRTGRHHGKQR